MKTLIALALVAATSSALAQTAVTQDLADVLEVSAYQQPGPQVCRQVPQGNIGAVYPPQERSNAGAIIGLIAGGIIGNQVGGGSGKAVATAIGAGTGAIVGDRLDNQNPNAPMTYVTQCEQQPGPVTYTYKARVRGTGQVIGGQTRTPIQPGQVLRAQVTTQLVP